MYTNIQSPDDTFQKQNDKLIAVLAIGEDFQEWWIDNCKENVLSYAERNSYDVCLITKHLDDTHDDRSPAWQKCLIPSQQWAQQYDRLLYLDSDIIVDPNAPDVVDYADSQKIGATLARSQLSRADKQVWLERRNYELEPSETEKIWSDYLQIIYDMHDLDGHDKMIATGMFVCQPELHKSIFKKVYNYDEVKTGRYEQPYLSYEILKSGVFQQVTPRFLWLSGTAISRHFNHIQDSEPLERLSKVIGIMFQIEMSKCYFMAIDDNLKKILKVKR